MGAGKLKVAAPDAPEVAGQSQVIRDEYGRPRVLIEDEFPYAEIGVEAQREVSGAIKPPVNRLHVWWARRPLTVSRATLLGSLLPSGIEKTEFLKLNGIPRGADPVRAQQLVNEVRAGVRKERVKDPFGYPRAYSTVLPKDDLARIAELMESTWGRRSPLVLDCFAGGGSIPFEAFRIGCTTIANELNPVASVIERATIGYPAQFGLKFAAELERLSHKITGRIERDLEVCFPSKPGEEDLCYIWVRTVSCDSCGLRVPLSPNWWLDKPNGLGFKPIVDDGQETVRFEVKHHSGDFDANEGSVTRGTARCLSCATTIPGSRISDESREGRLGHQLVAIGYRHAKGPRGRFFRNVEEQDLTGVARAEAKLAEQWGAWESKGLIPTEEIPDGNKTREPLNRGIGRWCDLFNPRQLLVHLSTLDAFLRYDWTAEGSPEAVEAKRVYAAMAQGKALNYGSLMSGWQYHRAIVANTFDRHDFAFMWSTGEIDGARNLMQWAFSSVIKDYKGLAKLLGDSKTGSIAFLNRDAANLDAIASGTVDSICIDPPYSDNVMYSEISDFFYVWQKRSIGDLFPESFQGAYTQKEQEAVANPARFRESRGKAGRLAERDYHAKMKAIFTECLRVLRDDGVMTVMFTHKKLEAWDSLAKALLDAGFEITATWPVHTESTQSLHQAKKNAASSTILLVCRKRMTQDEGWWDEDLKHRLDEKVKERASHFEAEGIPNQDLFIMCFGPALQVISEKWPVKTETGDTLRPQEALDRARRVLKEHRFNQIADGKANDLDPASQFYVLAWDTFRARVFPYDEARRLAIALGIDEKELTAKHIIKKAGNNVELLTPKQRAATLSKFVDAKSYDHAIDYVHGAILAYEAQKSQGLELFHERTKALQNEGYKKLLEVLSTPGVMPTATEVTEYHSLLDLLEANPQIGVKIRRQVTKEGKSVSQEQLDV